MQKFLQKISSKLTAVKVLLLAVGVMCSQVVWAEDLTEKWKANSNTSVSANTQLMSNEAITATTVFATTKNSESKTIAGESFTHYIQVRNTDYPTVEVPNGTENSGSTSLEFDVTYGGTLTLFYMRQSTAQTDNKGTYAENDGKDLKVYKQSDASVLTGTFTVDSESSDGKNGWATKVVTLEAGTKYTISAKGTTVRFYGFNYTYTNPWTNVYSRALTDWTDNDISSTEWVATNVTPTISSQAGQGIHCTGAPSGGYTVKKTFSISSNAKVKYEGVWSVNRATGRTNNYCYIQFGDKIRISIPNGTAFYLNTDGTSSTGSGSIKSTKGNGVMSYNFSIVINTATNEVESFTFDGTDLTSKVSGIVSGNHNSFTLGYDRQGGSGSSDNNLTSISVSQIEQAVTNVDYTINYQQSGVTVKTVSYTSTVGATITAETAIDGTEEGYVGVHYLTTADNAPTMVLVSDATSNVLNVPVRLPYSATVRLTKNINGTSSYVDQTFTETDEKVCSYAVGWPMYEKDGENNYYSLTEETNYCMTGFFTDGQTINKTVNYTTSASDVIWFYDVNGSTPNNSIYSGGSYTATANQLANVTVDAGIYDIIFSVVSKAGSGSSHRNEGVSVNGTNVANLSGNINGIRTLRIRVENDASVITAYGNGASNNTDNLDYVLIKKLPASVSVPVTAAGYTTFSSAYALDLVNIDGGKAFIADVQENGGTITMTEWTSAVPANTGLLIKANTAPAAGETATVTIPVAADGTAPTTNYLKATDGNDVEAGNYVFAFMTSDYSGAGFYKLDNATHIDAGKAYLDGTAVTSTGGAIKFRFDEDTATAISTVAEDAVKFDGATYNLAGQRVDASYKGIVIRNGKKFLVK